MFSVRAKECRVKLRKSKSFSHLRFSGASWQQGGFRTAAPPRRLFVQYLVLGCSGMKTVGHTGIYYIIFARLQTNIKGGVMFKGIIFLQS